MVELQVNGSNMTELQNACAQLTEWKELTELELKLSIEYQVANQQKVDYDKENECCLCFCTLYENLQEKSVGQLIKEQKDKHQELMKGNKLEIDVIKMGRCKGMHFYHKECIENQLKSTGEQKFIKCAVCNIIYGKQTGEMPSGTMTWRTQSIRQIPIQGYPGLQQAIQIDYSLPSGIYKGKHYHGTHRTAFLPNNKEGVEVLSLLAEAFRRRLTFKIGTSITSGATDCVVWQGIHHKTSPSGGPTAFGYPDETYFKRVKEELEQRGLTLDQIQLENPNNGNITVK